MDDGKLHYTENSNNSLVDLGSHMRRKTLLILFSLLALFAVPRAEIDSFDLIISHGRVIDGTGNPWFEADIAIKDGRIVEIGKLNRLRAAKEIDAKGLIVA